MKARALLVFRLLVVGALFPALAGCASSDQTLTRADVDDAPAPEAVAPGWAPVDVATIRPGVPIQTEAGECASNFVFIRPDNTSVFLGTSAYCVRELPVGSLASVGGPDQLAILIYSSWATMAENGEADPGAREYNDFAVFRIDSSSRDQVNPALLQTGGPTALGEPDAYEVGARLRAWAPDPKLPPQLHWREELVTGRAGDWALLAHGPLPGAPGTLGGGVVDEEGRAVGVLVNLGVLPNPGSNGIARLDMLMAYAKEHAKLDMQLATAEYAAPALVPAQ